MPNKEGRHNKLEVKRSGLPVYIPRSSRWTSKPYRFAVLLTRRRCQQFGVPVKQNEAPGAFLFSASAGVGTSDQQHRYYPAQIAKEGETYEQSTCNYLKK